MLLKVYQFHKTFTLSNISLFSRWPVFEILNKNKETGHNSRSVVLNILCVQTGCALSWAYRQCSYTLWGVNGLVLFQTPSICVRICATRAAVGPACWPLPSDADVAPRPRWAETPAEHLFAVVVSFVLCVTPKIWQTSFYNNQPPAPGCGRNSVGKI